MKPIQVGLLGIGTVGSGTFAVLKRNQEEIRRRAGRGIEITMVADLNVERAREIVGEGAQVVADARAVIANPDIDIVIELIGGYVIAKALACVELNLHLGTVEAVAVLLEMHIATRRHQLAAMLDFQCVGREQQPRLTQLNKPLGPGLLVDHALHALGLQHDGLITLACSSALSRPA